MIESGPFDSVLYRAFGGIDRSSPHGSTHSAYSRAFCIRKHPVRVVARSLPRASSRSHSRAAVYVKIDVRNVPVGISPGKRGTRRSKVTLEKWLSKRWVSGPLLKVGTASAASLHFEKIQRGWTTHASHWSAPALTHSPQSCCATLLVSCFTSSKSESTCARLVFRTGRLS